MPILAAELGVDEVDDPRFQAATCRWSYMPAQPRVMRPSGGDVGHLGDHQAGTADRPAPQVDQVPVADLAVLGRVHGTWG